MTQQLNAKDAHALARFFVGLPWQTSTPSPIVHFMLSQLDANKPDDLAMVRRLLSPEGIRQVIAVDPYASLPTNDEPELTVVPALPSVVELTANQLAEASTVGKWLDDYVTWAGDTANETPLAFHVGAGLFLGAAAIARRLSVLATWGEVIYPNLYVMIVAVSTYYRKSAGLKLAIQVMKAAFPHVLLPQPGSPENFLNMLGGLQTTNFDQLPEEDKERIKKGNQFAAQRVLVRDELSGLFKAMKQDFMSGLKEHLMQIYDNPDHLDTSTNQRGMIVIRQPSLSILGAATPAELSTSITANDWYNGNLARFALISPDPDYRERPAQHDIKPPNALIANLQRLHARLPSPVLMSGSLDQYRLESWSISLAPEVWQYITAYEQAIRQLTAPDSMLDDRLRPVYGRLHVQAIKVAIILAALDWAAKADLARPVVLAAHWFRAQQIVEGWRASAHRLLQAVGESEESRLEDRLLRALKAHPHGLTARDLYRMLKSTRKPTQEALDALSRDNRLEEFEYQPPTGRKTQRYRLLEK